MAPDDGFGAVDHALRGLQDSQVGCQLMGWKKSKLPPPFSKRHHTLLSLHCAKIHGLAHTPASSQNVQIQTTKELKLRPPLIGEVHDPRMLLLELCAGVLHMGITIYV